MSIIETYNLTKTFKSRTGLVEAVRSVNLKVNEGEIFGFLGPNGAGKTTTMRILTTLLTPTSGKAIVAGHDLICEPGKVRLHIGYVSQAGGVEASATARENLVLQARLYGLSKAEAHNRSQELINALDLGSFADRIARTYSGGQRRRLDLALGMVHRPKLLFLDEPTTGLDPQSRANLWDEIRSLRETGTTVFITTHYLDEADALCDRLAIMDHGVIVSEGSPVKLKRQISGDIIVLNLTQQAHALKQAEELLKSQSFVRTLSLEKESLRIYVEQGEQALPLVLRALDSAQIAIETVSLKKPSLDDVFLQQTGRSLRETTL